MPVEIPSSFEETFLLIRMGSRVIQPHDYTQGAENLGLLEGL